MGRHLRFAVAVLAGLVTFPLSGPAETLKIGGTGAVTALLQDMAGAFGRVAPDDRLEVIPGLGSSGGIAAAEAGAITLAVTGRALRESERAAGLLVVPFLETPFVFAASTGVSLSLSRSDLIGIYTGALVAYPDGAPLRLILRPRSDAQTLMMVRHIEGMAAALETARLRSELPVAGNDQDNMDLARRLEGAFGGFPLTQLASEANTFRHVVIDGVAPTLEEMREGRYPYRLQVDFVSKGPPSAAARRFLAFLASPEAAAMIEKAGAIRVRAP